jgi:hypothetical protein
LGLKYFFNIQIIIKIILNTITVRDKIRPKTEIVSATVGVTMLFFDNDSVLTPRPS